ncbi:MAG: LmeA family phospholipid-binding protein, partial [Chloroflexi bacterium]|nr:LmeA family phospholipid-binding protein [Chloroflexota bacterium]
MRLLVVLVLLAGLGYGGVQVLSRLQQQQPPLAAGLKRIEITPTAVRSFDEKVDAIEKAADDAKRTGKATAVEVTFTEQELTSKLADASAVIGGIAATDTQIHLTGGNVVATSKVNVSGIEVNVGVVATPVVEAGQAKLVVTDVQTGGVPIPDALKDQLRTQLGQAIDPRSLGLPFDISKLQIVDGKVVISGTV